MTMCREENRKLNWCAIDLLRLFLFYLRTSFLSLHIIPQEAWSDSFVLLIRLLIVEILWDIQLTICKSPVSPQTTPSW